MRPTALKPGDQVIVSGRVMTFLRRERQPCRSAVNWFRCDDFRGLDGPNDEGKSYDEMLVAENHLDLIHSGKLKLDFSKPGKRGVK